MMAGLRRCSALRRVALGSLAWESRRWRLAAGGFGAL
jgi:hypothetical protein